LITKFREKGQEKEGGRKAEARAARALEDRRKWVILQKEGLERSRRTFRVHNGGYSFGDRGVRNPEESL